MYKVKLNDNRIVVQCNVLRNGKVKFIGAVYDTGAKYSCFRAAYISTGMTENDFLDKEEKLLSGFVKSSASKFYRLQVDRFAVGNIDLGTQDIWITFDERVTSNVVGYDIISQVTRASLANSGEECFFSSNIELKQYIDTMI